MTLHCCRAIALAVAIVSITGCSSSKKSDTPSSLREIYSEQAIGALKNASEMRVDRITRTSEGASSDFELKEYRVVQPGRSLTAEEMEKLREVLLSPRTYTTMPYECYLEPEYAFTLAGIDTTRYFIIGNDCHLAALQTASSREDVNLTEKTSTLLSAICEHAFQ